VTKEGRRSSVGRGSGRGPRGPGAHWRLAWVACLAGGRRPATKSEAAELGTCGGIGDDAVELGRPASIPWTGK
jgi:hypothetical protein